MDDWWSCEPGADVVVEDCDLVRRQPTTPPTRLPQLSVLSPPISKKSGWPLPTARNSALHAEAGIYEDGRHGAGRGKPSEVSA
jgi:hypothetical protein